MKKRTVAIDEAISDPKWYDDPEGGKFKIRPYPASKQTFTLSSSGDIIVDNRESLKMLMYCLMDWEGVVDTDDKPIPCNDKNKRFLFEWDKSGIATFVVTKIKELERDRGETEKN